MEPKLVKIKLKKDLKKVKLDRRARNKGGDIKSARALGQRKKTIEKVFEMRLQGATWDEISRAVGLTNEACHSSFWAHVKSFPQDSIENQRTAMNMRLQFLRWQLWKKFFENPLKASEALIKIEDRIARLNGLDAAVKTEISGPGGGPVSLSLDLFAELRTRYESFVKEAKPVTALPIRPLTALPGPTPNGLSS